MKWRVSIVLFGVGVIFAACTPKSLERQDIASLPSAAPELQAVDSLMWRQPDSALTCLLPYFDTCCRDAEFCISTASEHDRHYAHLLLAELLYKNDYEQTNRRGLREAMWYFDSLMVADGADTRGESLQPRPHKDELRASSKNIAFLDARTHYINGVGYYERDSLVEACKEFMKALEVMEGHFEADELTEDKARFMAFSFTRLTELYSSLYFHEQAIYFAKLSLVFYNKYASSPEHIVWILDEIGSHYDMMSSYDSAYVYYKKGIEALPDTNNLVYRDLTAHRILLSYETDKNPDTALHQLYQLLALSDSDKEYLSRCLSIGDIYFHESQFDSAFTYLSIVYNDSESTDSKKQAAEWLARICMAQGKDSERLVFAEFLVPFANLNENNSHLKSQLAELCNEYEQSRQDRILLCQRSEVKTNVFIIGGIVLAFLLGSISFHLISKKKRNTERDKKTNPDATTNSVRAQSFSFAENYADEPICQHILAVCNDKKNPIKSTVPYSAYSGISLDNAQMAQLKNAAYHHYKILFEKIEKEYPELKDKDFHYCFLCLLGIDNVQIAALLQKSNSTIWDREKRLQKILGCNDKIAITLHRMIASL